jgi:hypothetical protein
MPNTKSPTKKERHSARNSDDFVNRCNARHRTKGARELQTHIGFSSTSYSQLNQWKPQSLTNRKSNDSKLRKGSLRIASSNSSMPAHTAERKRLTRAKIILGSLVLRNHVELLRQLIAEASPQDGELLRSVFPNATKEDSPSLVQSQ